MKLTILLAAAIIVGLPMAALSSLKVEVDEPAICLACHDEFEAIAEKPYVHTALADGKCSSCHNPHAAQHASLLNSDVLELCLDCHQDIQGELGLAHAHAPATEGNCLACHDPHASDHKAQLKGVTADLCGGCHTSLSSWLDREVVHQPVADGDCGACHNSHGSDNTRLLADRLPKLCFECHDNDATFADAHQGYELSESNCITCHDPHASSLPSLIMPNQHAPFAGGQCNACHDSKSASPFAIKGEIKAVCTRCHAAIKKEADKLHAGHVNDDRSCMNCHNAHASSVDNLLAAEQQVVCLHCHFNDEEYAGKSRSSILTHDGMDCDNCHEPHGSDNESYLLSMQEDLCAGCHAGAHASSHPLGPDIIDHRTNKPLTCLSCHQLHGADFEPFLPLSPKMDLCIQCHRR
jgi:predicted CXXCH cytochrome family protein